MAEAVTHTTILIRDYLEAIKPTDRLPPGDLRPVLFGIFGEVGGIMATAKKMHREQKVYSEYRRTVIEEFGDTLWYLVTLCRRLAVSFEDLLGKVVSDEAYTSVLAASDTLDGAVSRIAVPAHRNPLDATLLDLGNAAASLMSVTSATPENVAKIHAFCGCYLSALQAADVTFDQVVRTNRAKTTGRFLPPDYSVLPTFDSAFDPEERLPDHFEIEITQRRSGQTFLRWNGVFIGAPLTDNIMDADGYRFHDVFHFAHAAILHWSPTMRALIKQKRKSDKKMDEAEDGGRAIVVEEGLTAWIFSRAKELDFFEHQSSISFDMLKTISEFVRGYEVAECPMSLWEKAILEGYAVFRQVRDNKGGIAVGDRESRTIQYKAP